MSPKLEGSLRALFCGLVAGALLSALRAPLGLDLVQAPAVLGTTAALHRAAALFALALAAGAGRRAFAGEVAVPSLLLGATAGYAAHGLLVLSRFEPEGRVGHALLLVLGTVLLLAAAGRARAAKEPAAEAGPGRLERIGLIVVGLGVAIAFEQLARHLRLFGMGLPEDDTVAGAVVLAGLWIGALAFGRALGLGTAAAAPALALAAAASWVGLRFLGGLGHDPLYRYLGRFELDYLMVGTAQAMAVLAGASFVLPAFLAGAGLHGLRRGRRLASVLLGAGLGVLASPHLVLATSRPLSGTEVFASPWAWKLFALGTTCAALGALLAALSTSGRAASAAGRALAVAGVAAALALAWLGPRPAVWPLSPWFPTPIQPVVSMHTPEGLVTVEPDRGTSLVVTLDRRRVTPTVDEEDVDARRLRQAWSLLAPELRAPGHARVLVVGQLTPFRLSVLQSLGARRIERTAPWSSALPAVEAALFEDAAPPPGAPLAPAEARARLRAGEYDLVVSLPVIGPIQFPKTRALLEWAHGPAPVAGWSVPEGTLAVVWVDAGAPLAGRALTERVALALDDFQHLTLGLLAGSVPQGSAAPEQPALFPGGERAPRVESWTLLATRPKFRGDRNRRDLLARLRAAAQGTALSELALGLELHFAAQQPSSPFETLAQQIEIEEEELMAFDRAVRAVAPAPLDATTRSVWESLAWLLAEKRMIDKVLVHVEPVAEAYAPWPELDRAVARAYEEFDEPADAARVLERLVAAQPRDIGLLAEAAEWTSRAGRHAAAIDLARRAEALQPGRYDLRRTLGLVLLRAGNPEGRALLEQLARENPEDEELLELLRGGPEPPSGFLPENAHAGHDH